MQCVPGEGVWGRFDDIFLLFTWREGVVLLGKAARLLSFGAGLCGQTGCLIPNAFPAGSTDEQDGRG